MANLQDTVAMVQVQADERIGFGLCKMGLGRYYRLRLPLVAWSVDGDPAHFGEHQSHLR